MTAPKPIKVRRPTPAIKVRQPTEAELRLKQALRKDAQHHAYSMAHLLGIYPA